MRTLEASGKTIDEAIFNGLKELEVSIDEVEIDKQSIALDDRLSNELYLKKTDEELLENIPQ